MIKKYIFQGTKEKRSQVRDLHGHSSQPLLVFHECNVTIFISKNKFDMSSLMEEVRSVREDDPMIPDDRNAKVQNDVSF